MNANFYVNLNLRYIMIFSFYIQVRRKKEKQNRGKCENFFIIE